MRVCDSPMPMFGGNMCADGNVQGQGCNLHPCGRGRGAPSHAHRHEDEWNRLQTLLPRPDEELEPNILVINGFDLSRLSPLERETLGLLRDGGSLGQLLKHLQAQPIEICRAVHVLMGSRLLRRVSEEGA